MPPQQAYNKQLLDEVFLISRINRVEVEEMILKNNNKKIP